MSLVEILKSGNYRVIDVREPLELKIDDSAAKIGRASCRERV